MAIVFPSEEWVSALKEKLNSDEQYQRIANNWEGDIIYVVEPSGALGEEIKFYIDLWHGTCREAIMLKPGEEKEAAFVLRASYDNLSRILKGDLDPMQAMLTRKLKVEGSMIYMMRNVPTVLDYVRCCQEITESFLGE
jgi:putative sterol carrier protein